MKKNVLHVVSISFSLPYFIGDQFDYFRDKGVNFYVACSPSNHLDSYSEKKKFKTIPLQILREINPIVDLKTIISLYKEIKKNKIDIVVGHSPKGAMVAMIASYFARVNKRIYFRHGIMLETSKGLKRKILTFIEKLTGRLATDVVCVSPWVMQKSNELNFNKPEKNIVLNLGSCNGVNFNKFEKSKIDDIDVLKLKDTYNIRNNDRVVGYVGRIVNDKGINELLEAWKLIVKKYSFVKLLLVGPFEERDSISVENKKFIAQEPSIIHTGLIEEVKPFYDLMHVFAFPSHREGFGTVVLEASSMELPIITTNHTGCVDSIVVNKTGIFTELSPLGIFNSISYYLDNEQIRIEHGRNGRAHVIENFSEQVIWNELHKFYLS